MHSQQARVVIAGNYNAIQSKTEIMEDGLLHTLNHDAPSLSMSARPPLAAGQTASGGSK
jgi:hypothetical protein